MFVMDKPRGPRPIEGQDGNWKCGVCETINFASRTECHRCKSHFPGMPGNGPVPMATGFPGPTAQFPGPVPSAFLGGKGCGGGGGSAPIEGVGGNWRCSTCANVNFAKRDHCNRCQSERPPIDQILAREQELEQERAVAAATGATVGVTQIGVGMGRGKFAPPVAGIDGNWECLTCMSVNFASREQCHRCTAGRPPQEHIKRRAEQIKTERAIQLAAGQNPSGAVGGLGAAAGLGAAPTGLGGPAATLPGASLPGAALPGALPHPSSTSSSLQYFQNPEHGAVNMAPGAQGPGQPPPQPPPYAQQQPPPQPTGFPGQHPTGYPNGTGQPGPPAALPPQAAQPQQSYAKPFGGGLPGVLPDGSSQQFGQLHGALPPPDNGAPQQFKGLPGLAGLPSADPPGQNGISSHAYPPYPGVDAVGAADWSVGGNSSLGVPAAAALENGGENGKRQRPEDDPLLQQRIVRGMALRSGDCAAWVSACGMVHFSQQTGAPIDGLTEGCDLSSTYAQRQTISALTNLEALLASAGSSKDRLVEVCLNVCSPDDLEGVQIAWADWVQGLEGHLPAKTVTIGPSTSGRHGCRVELKAIAQAGALPAQ